MRIAMFTDSWLPTHDGCVTSILKFREGLEKRGHKVFIFAPEDRAGLAREDDRTFLFKSRELPQYPDYRMAIRLSARKDALLREHDIQMLHSHGIAFMGFKAMMSSRVLKIPILMHFHTWVNEVHQYYPVNLNDALLEDLSWRYLRPLCRRSDGVVAPSEAAINELRQKVPGMAYTDWVFPGIDAERFNPGVRGNGVRERHGLTDKEVILHVGRLSLEKNIELVLKSMLLLKRSRPDARLLIVGTGPARAHYEGMVKELRLEGRVTFAGFVPDEELPSYYAASDAFVIASKFETLGIVMTEALASGKPVAGINCRVIPDVITEGHNGYLFREDAGDCAGKIMACLDAPPEVRENAVRSSSMFDTDRAMDRLEMIYRNTEDVHARRMEKAGHAYRRILA